MQKYMPFKTNILISFFFVFFGKGSYCWNLGWMAVMQAVAEQIWFHYWREIQTKEKKTLKSSERILGTCKILGEMLRQVIQISSSWSFTLPGGPKQHSLFISDLGRILACA